MKTKNIFNIFSISLILFALAAGGSSCMKGDTAWKRGAERDVVRNGISFKIFREYPDGNKIGTMTEDMVIDGWPCAKKLISFYREWELDALTLFEDYECNGVSMPAGTRVFLYLDGKPMRCVFPHAVEIQGYLVKGNWDNVYEEWPDTPRASFYPSGKLKVFHIKGSEVIDGVTCEHRVRLFENGRLEECGMAKPAKIEVDEFQDDVVCGGWITFYQPGKLRSCNLAEPYKIGDKEIPEGTFINFDPSGTVSILEGPCTVTTFDPTGEVVKIENACI